MARNTTVSHIIHNNVVLTDTDARYYRLLQDMLKLVTELAGDKCAEDAMWAKTKITKYNSFMEVLKPKLQK